MRPAARPRKNRRTSPKPMSPQPFQGDTSVATPPSSSRMLTGYLTDIEQLLEEQRWDAALREARELPRIAVALSDPQFRCSGEAVGVWCEQWLEAHLAPPLKVEGDPAGCDWRERLGATSRWAPTALAVPWRRHRAGVRRVLRNADRLRRRRGRLFCLDPRVQSARIDFPLTSRPRTPSPALPDLQPTSGRRSLRSGRR